MSLIGTMNDTIILQGLEIECVIGVFDWERKIRQRVRIDFELMCDTTNAAATDDLKHTVDYKSIAKEIIALVEPSGYQLIETMAEAVAAICLSRSGVERAVVTVSKPGAVRGAKNVAVRVNRPRPETVLYLGLGGNVEPEKNIPTALDLIRERFDVVVVSPVYCSTAWGVKSPQADYHNLAIEATTGHDLFTVRAELRWIEELLGRSRTLDKFAPRTVDIDLLLFGDTVQKEPGGTLPHPQLLTQQFVYLPMSDIAPDVIVPDQGKKLCDLTPVYADPSLKITQLGPA